MMKKQLFILGAGILLLSACSTENDDLLRSQQQLVDAYDVDEVIEGVVEESDVPIRFANSTTTRAYLQSDPFKCDNVGIFCLASQGIDGTSSSGVVWDGSSRSGTNNALNQWVVNAKAKIESSSDPGIGSIRWLDGAADHYYPQANLAYKYAYSFAAYHPYVEDKDIEMANNVIYAHFDGLNGNTDIISAIATANNDEDEDGNPDENEELAVKAYSVSYFNGGGTKKPYFKFSHRMSRLIISMKVDDSYTGGEEFWVDSVWINNLLDSIRMPIIAFGKSGGVVTVSSPDYLRVYMGSTSTYYLRDENDKSLRDDTDDKWMISATTPIKQIGDCIMIPPLRRGYIYNGDDKVTNATTLTNLMTLTIRIRLKDIAGNAYNYRATIPPPTNGWKSGKHYPINLKISPSGQTDYEMEARAEIIDTEDDSDWTTTDYDAVE